MTRLTRDELVDLMDQCGGALLEEQAAHAQTRAALAAAEAKAEAVGGLPGKWDCLPSAKAAEGLSTAEFRQVRDTYAFCASDVEDALASLGPSLRERVEGALTEIRAVAGRMQANVSKGEPKAYGLNRAADLVQDALEGRT